MPQIYLPTKQNPSIFKSGDWVPYETYQPKNTIKIYPESQLDGKPQTEIVKLVPTTDGEYFEARIHTGYIVDQHGNQYETKSREVPIMKIPTEHIKGLNKQKIVQFIEGLDRQKLIKLAEEGKFPTVYTTIEEFNRYHASTIGEIPDTKPLLRDENGNLKPAAKMIVFGLASLIAATGVGYYFHKLPTANASQGGEILPSAYSNPSNPSIRPVDVYNAGTIYKGDFNKDLKVDWDDVQLFAKHFGYYSWEDGYLREYDLDRNGDIDFKDFIIFLDQYGRRYKYLPLLDVFNMSPEIFSRVVLSKIMTSGKDIDSQDVKEYLEVLARQFIDNPKTRERVKYIIKNGFGMEDGIFSEAEKEVIEQYLKNGIVDESLAKKLVKLYAEKVDEKINGMGSEFIGLANNMEELEALEDIYGQIIRSEPYDNPKDRFKNPTRESEIFDAFLLILKHGSSGENEEEREFHEIERLSRKMKIDGHFDDWAGVEPYTIKKEWNHIPKEYGIEQLFTTWDKSNNLNIFVKTPKEPIKDKDFSYEITIFGSKMDDALFKIILSGGKAYFYKYEFYYDRHDGLYKTRSEHLSGLHYAFGPDGIEIQITSKTAKELGENVRISAFTLKKEVENSIDKMYMPSAIIGRDKVYPVFVTHQLPKYNVPLYILLNLGKNNEFRPSEIISPAVAMTEASIFVTFDDETKAKMLEDLNKYYNFMKKYDNNLDLFDAILLVSRQSPVWNSPLYSEKLRSPFSGFDKVLNKYDYWFNITTPESYEKLHDIYKNYNDPERLGADANTGSKYDYRIWRDKGYNTIKVKIDGKEFTVASYIYASTNAMLQIIEKEGKVPVACTERMRMALDALRSRGFIPIEFDITSPIYESKSNKLPVNYSIHYQPGWIENGRIFIIPTMDWEANSHAWLSIPSIGLSPHQTRIHLTEWQLKSSFNWGIEKDEIKKALYEKWLGEN